MPTTHLSTRARRLARIVRAERHLERVAHAALMDLTGTALAALTASNMDTVVLDARSPEWLRAVEEDLMPAVAAVFGAAYADEARTPPVTAAASMSPEDHGEVALANQFGTEYLLSARNRLVGVADTVFARIRTSLEEGRQEVFTHTDKVTGETYTTQGASIPQLAARIDALLTDGENWDGRATVIARTEVIGANNAGAAGAAAANAVMFGTGPETVAKEWLATSDHRTRESHSAADGQVVIGLNTPFVVGGSWLQYPGDPSGPAREVVNCRCTPLYTYPGDPSYPGALVASATTQEEVVTAVTPEAPEPLTGPTHAGLAVQALDTGRILLLQRSLDPEDEARGKWEFPGGGIEEGESPLDGARREWHEETGMIAPTEDPVGGWTSPDGIYQAFVVQVPTEASLALNPDDHTGDGNPDDPDREAPEVTAWFTAEDVEAMGDAIRREVRESTDWTQFAPTVDPDTQDTAALVAAGGRATVLRLQGNSFAQIAQRTGFSTPTAARWAMERSVWANGGRIGRYADDEGTEPLPPGDRILTPPRRAQDISTDGNPWYGIACPEGVISGDARQFSEGASTWRDLPLPLMYQDATALGHDGAVRVGRIDVMERDSTTYAKPMIRFNGVWDTSPIAREAERQVEARMLRGVSIDGDDVEVELLGSDGSVLDPMADMAPADGVVIENATAVRICGATLCSVPAFHQAYVANGVRDPAAEEPGQVEVAEKEQIVMAPATDADTTIAVTCGGCGDEVVFDTANGWQRADGSYGCVTGTHSDHMPPPNADLIGEVTAAARATASAPAWTFGLVASAARNFAPTVPAAHFSNPNLEVETPLTVTEDGRVYGHLAVWGTCHLGVDGICQEPPVSASNYGFFNTGVVYTDDGGQVSVGQLQMGTLHADLRLNYQATQNHYANTSVTVADVTMGQDGLGIWFSGHIRPGATPEQIYALRASGAVSGDWRETARGSGDLELIAALVVNTPGFALQRPALAASAGRVTALVASGVVLPPSGALVAAASVGKAVVDVEASPASVRSFADAVTKTLTQRQRVEAAATQLRTRRARLAAARLEGRH